jgi:hypothetical protein
MEEIHVGDDPTVPICDGKVEPERSKESTGGVLGAPMEKKMFGVGGSERVTPTSPRPDPFTRFF